MNISIDNPCSENFNDFKKTEKGGFCDSCKKEVVDFTHFSQQQLVKYFDSTLPTCGKFLPEQLGEIKKLNERSGFIKSYLAVGVSLIALLASNNSNGQNTSKQEIKVIKNLKSHSSITDKLKTEEKKSIISKRTVKITGQLIDENDEPLIGAYVIPQNKKTQGAITDLDGNFLLVLDSCVINEVTLEFSYILYKKKEMKLTLTSSEIQLDTIRLNEKLQLTNSHVCTVGMIRIEKKWTPRWVWRKITSPFR